MLSAVTSLNVRIFTTPHHLKNLKGPASNAVRWCGCVCLEYISEMLRTDRGPYGPMREYVVM